MSGKNLRAEKAKIVEDEGEKEEPLLLH